GLKLLMYFRKNASTVTVQGGSLATVQAACGTRSRLGAMRLATVSPQSLAARRHGLLRARAGCRYFYFPRRHRQAKAAVASGLAHDGAETLPARLVERAAGREPVDADVDPRSLLHGRRRAGRYCRVVDRRQRVGEPRCWFSAGGATALGSGCSDSAFDLRGNGGVAGLCAAARLVGQGAAGAGGKTQLQDSRGISIRACGSIRVPAFA